MMQRYIVLACKPDGDHDLTGLVPAAVLELDDATGDDELLAVLSVGGFLEHRPSVPGEDGGTGESLEGILVGGSVAGRLVVIFDATEPPEPDLKDCRHCVLKVMHEEVHAALVRQHPDQEFLREPIFKASDDTERGQDPRTLN